MRKYSEGQEVRMVSLPPAFRGQQWIGTPGKILEVDSVETTAMPYLVNFGEINLWCTEENIEDLVEKGV